MLAWCEKRGGLALRLPDCAIVLLGKIHGCASVYLQMKANFMSKRPNSHVESSHDLLLRCKLAGDSLMRLVRFDFIIVSAVNSRAEHLQNNFK